MQVSIISPAEQVRSRSCRAQGRRGGHKPHLPRESGLRATSLQAQTWRRQQRQVCSPDTLLDASTVRANVPAKRPDPNPAQTQTHHPMCTQNQDYSRPIGIRKQAKAHKANHPKIPQRVPQDRTRTHQGHDPNSNTVKAAAVPNPHRENKSKNTSPRGNQASQPIIPPASRRPTPVRNARATPYFQVSPSKQQFPDTRLCKMP